MGVLAPCIVGIHCSSLLIFHVLCHSLGPALLRPSYMYARVLNQLVPVGLLGLRVRGVTGGTVVPMFSVVVSLVVGEGSSLLCVVAIHCFGVFREVDVRDRVSAGTGVTEWKPPLSLVEAEDTGKCVVRCSLCG